MILRWMKIIVMIVIVSQELGVIIVCVKVLVNSKRLSVYKSCGSTECEVMF